MNNLYEALENCLQVIEGGADIETALLHYPDLADELRPILESSVEARKMAVLPPSKDVVGRNRAKVLQQAAQMREKKARASQRMWFVMLRRLAVTLVVLTVLSVSGTSLVRASSTTLPGDNLYPVKRTWEDVLVAFTFNAQQRDALEVEHENERLQELQELFAEGRSAEVDFAGSVTKQNGNDWIVSNIPINISAHTEIRGGPITMGSAVRVKGQTQSTNIVLAERIELLPAGVKLPDVGDEAESQIEKDEGSNPSTEDGSGGGTPQVGETQTAEPNSERNGETVTEGSNHNGNESNIEATPDPGNSSDHGVNGSTSGDSGGSNDSHEGSNQNSNESWGGGGSSSGGGGGD